jgi:hypothetical protein
MVVYVVDTTRFPIILKSPRIALARATIVFTTTMENRARTSPAISPLSIIE